MSYVSSMRSNLELMRRSRDVRSADLAAARVEFSSYLASRVLIYPPSMLLAGLRPDMSYQDRKQVLGLQSGGVSSPTSEELEFSEFLETSSRKSRRAAWIWRIGSECEDMRDRGWYPFFVTLTVDPSRVADSEAMWRDGVEFRRYIRRLARVSCAAFGQPSAIKDGASDSVFVRHVGIIEHGKSNQHHHMHLLIWMRAIPASWKVCPNRGIANAGSRTICFCRQMQTYWPHSLPGIGRALFFRHEGDVWSRLGFCIPVSRKDGKALRVNPARAAGYYVSKYMEKGDRAWLHRVKATRDLGMARLRAIMFSLATRKVEALSWRPRCHHLSVLVQTIHSVPQGLLRSTAKQVLFCKMWDSEQPVPTSWLHQSSGIYKPMLESVRGGAQPSRMSLKAFYDWVTGFLPVPSGYCEKRLGSSHLNFMADFPPDTFRSVLHVGGNDIG